MAIAPDQTLVSTTAGDQALSTGGFYLDLTDGEHVIGWLAPDTIGFRGFASARDAAYAAWVAFRALSQRDQRRALGALPALETPLQIVEGANGSSVMTGGQSIARLLDPSEDPHRAAPTYAFELRLDARRDEIAVRALSHRIYRALRRSGIAWSLFPGAEPAAAPASSVGDGTMRIDAPLPGWAALVSVGLVIVATGVLWPVVGFGIAAIAGTLGFIFVWLLFRRRHLPPNAMPREAGVALPGKKQHYHEGR